MLNKERYLAGLWMIAAAMPLIYAQIAITLTDPFSLIGHDGYLQFLAPTINFLGAPFSGLERDMSVWATCLAAWSINNPTLTNTFDSWVGDVAHSLAASFYVALKHFAVVDAIWVLGLVCTVDWLWPNMARVLRWPSVVMALERQNRRLNIVGILLPGTLFLLLGGYFLNSLIGSGSLYSIDPIGCIRNLQQPAVGGAIQRSVWHEVLLLGLFHSALGLAISASLQFAIEGTKIYRDPARRRL